jgi:hypothetical protein
MAYHQTIVGSSVTRSEDIHKLVKHLNYTDAYSRERLFAPRIFGDDIICDSRTTDKVVALLKELGLAVNEAKSFRDMQCIRESCGIYAYRGHDVTPLMFRVKNDANKAVVYTSLIGSINNFGDYGYRHTHSFLIGLLKDRFEDDCDLPFVDSPTEFGVYTKNRLKCRFVRYNVNYQRDERLVLVVKGSSFSDNISEDYLYSQWAKLSSEPRSIADENTAMARRQPLATSFSRRWIPG